MATRKVQTGLRLEETLYEKVVLLSQREGRSLNNMTEYIIRSWIENYEQDHGQLIQPIEGQLSVQDL